MRNSVLYIAYGRTPSGACACARCARAEAPSRSARGRGNLAASCRRRTGASARSSLGSRSSRICRAPGRGGWCARGRAADQVFLAAGWTRRAREREREVVHLADGRYRSSGGSGSAPRASCRCAAGRRRISGRRLRSRAPRSRTRRRIETKLRMIVAICLLIGLDAVGKYPAPRRDGALRRSAAKDSAYSPRSSSSLASA